MIRFLCDRSNLHPVMQHIAGEGRHFQDRVRVVRYDRIDNRWAGDPPPGLYVFTDIDLLEGDLAARARDFWVRLQSAPDRYRTLNEPGRTLTRLPLLELLHEGGINDYRAWPATEVPADVRFPVFLRLPDDHQGPRTGLIQDRTELGEAIRRAEEGGSESWICCEWAAHADAEGVYRKYGAAVVGDAIIPRHLLFSDDWVVKYTERTKPDLLAEEQRYLSTNPHADELRAVCRLAGIEYGRIDYDVAPHGALRIWEINTNPVIFPASMTSESLRWGVNCRQTELWMDAVVALDPTPEDACRPSASERLVLAMWRRTMPRYTSPFTGRVVTGLLAGLNGTAWRTRRR